MAGADYMGQSIGWIDLLLQDKIMMIIVSVVCHSAMATPQNEPKPSPPGVLANGLLRFTKNLGPIYIFDPIIRAMRRTFPAASRSPARVWISCGSISGTRRADS